MILSRLFTPLPFGRFKTIVTVCGIIGVWALLSAAAGADLAERIPPTARLLVASSQVSQTCRTFEKTALGRKLCGPEFGPLTKKLKGLNWSSPLLLQPTFGFGWAEVAEVPDPGGFVVFPAADGSLGVAWVFTPPKMMPTTRNWLYEGEQYFRGQGYRKTIEQRGDITLAVFHPPAARKGAATRVYFTSEQFYGAANSMAATDTILQVTPGKSLASDAQYKQSLLARSERGESVGADTSFFVRPIELLELLDSADKPRDAKANDALRKARRFALDEFKTLAGQAIFKPADPCDFEIRAKLVSPRPYRKAMRLLELKPGPVPPPAPWIEAGFSSVFFWRWDFAKAMKGYGTLFDEANWPGPEGEGLFDETLDALRDDPELRIDMRRDLFEQVGPEILRVNLGAGGGKDETEKWLFMVAVRNRAKVLDVFQRFYRGDQDVTHQALAGHDLWTVAEGRSLFVEGESDSVVTVRALALGAKQLFFSTDTELLKSAISGGQGGPLLRDDGDANQMLKWMTLKEGPLAALRGLTRLDRALEASYASATSSEPASEDGLTTQLWMYLLYGRSDRNSSLPYSAAPRFDSLRSGLPLTGVVLSEIKDGWTLALGMYGKALVAGEAAKLSARHLAVPAAPTGHRQP